MTFFTLSVKDYFGGKVLLLNTDGDIRPPQHPQPRKRESLSPQGFSGDSLTDGTQSPSNRREHTKHDDHGTLSVVTIHVTQSVLDR
jgi:hypothetical protein